MTHLVGAAFLPAHYLLNVEITLTTCRRHISHFLPLYRREPLHEASILFVVS
jgi:hypothetical protein